MKRTGMYILLMLCMANAGFAAEPPVPPARIVSLAPSTTEILFALGLGENIAGVTTFCDYPEEAKKKSKIGGMSNPSIEAVVSLKPELVVMTTDGNPKEFEERLNSLRINTYVFTARRLIELPQGIRALAAAVGVPGRGEQLASEVEKAIRAAGTGGRDGQPKNGRKTRDEGRREPQTSRKKVLFIVWPEPLIVAGPGTAMDDAISLLGHENIAQDAKTTYPKYSIEEVIRRAPDVLFIGRATGMDMREVSQGFLKRLSTVPAVRNNKVFYTGDNLYRLGPRVVKGIEELAECLR